jgi:hypothetical protein
VWWKIFSYRIHERGQPWALNPGMATAPQWLSTFPLGSLAGEDTEKFSMGGNA